MSTRQNPATDSSPSAPEIPALREVRYSLPEMLSELQLERTTGAFSQEKLYQVEIGKLFQNRKKRRGKSS